MRNPWLVRFFALALISTALESPGAAGSDTPFADAVAVWHMDRALSGAAGNGGLTVEGGVSLGLELDGPDRESSILRGGDGRVATFEGGFLRVAPSSGRPLALRGKHATIAMRVRDRAGAWDTPLLGTDAPEDPYAILLDARGGALRYLWRTEPAVRRVLGAPVASATYGFNGQDNDRHDLATYTPGEFAISVLTVDEAGSVRLSHNGRSATGPIDIRKQEVGDRLSRVGAKHDDSEFFQGDLAELLVYDRVLDDEERTLLERHLAAKYRLGNPPPAAADRPIPDNGLVLRLDATEVDADPMHPDRAGPLTSWIDTRGTGRSFNQADPSHRPELVPNVLGGRPVVRFRGSQVLDGPPVLPVGCDHFTFVAVWRREDFSGSEVIFEQSSPGPGRRASLLTTGSSGHPDFIDGVLRLSSPLEAIDPRRWHDVIVRFRDANLELFIDGVLVDEEWPHGELHRFEAPFLIGAGYDHGNLLKGFRGQIDHLALWDRALGDVEIAALSGGASEVARRDLEILGPGQASLQYWKPRGLNVFAGDCIPFFHDGTFHLFYLFDRRHHGSKWGQGAHQYAHATTRDLVHWDHQPMAVPITRQWECAMGTGDVLWHDGAFHVFYTDCGGRCEYRDKPQRGNWIFAARSTDGIHFEKDLQPLVPGHDCEVFRDPATGLFHLIRGGENRLVSRDLRLWEETPGEFVARRPGTTGECPNHFEWNGWYYFLLGTNAAWKSRSPLGPWEEIAPTVYDGLFVPKVAGFTGNRRILAGFLFDQGWGGYLAFRELLQRPDGSLDMKFPPEMIPACGEPVALRSSPRDPDVTGTARQVAIHAGVGLSMQSLAGVPRNARITLRVVPGPGARAFGLCLQGQTTDNRGCELRFEPERHRAQYGPAVGPGLAPESNGRIALGRDFALEGVDGLDRPFTLDIILRGDIIDTCIDQRRTMITRRDPSPGGDRLFLFAQGGDVRFDDIVVRPLRP